MKFNKFCKIIIFTKCLKSTCFNRIYMLDILGNRIAEMRKKRDLSQAELGQLVNKSKDVIGKYERGKTSASIEVIVKIAQVLEVPLDYLVGNTHTYLNQETLERLNKIEEMPKKEQAIVYHVIDSLIRDYNVRTTYK